MALGSSRHRAAIFAAAIVTLTLVAAGCSSDDGGGSTGVSGGNTGATGAGTTVDVTVQEYAILPGTATAAAGTVTFDVTNNGPDDTHEFVVFKTDLAPDALPTTEDGSVDETGEGVELIDELEDIAVGDTPALTVDLAAGNYVFICNIVEQEGGETVSHYQQGMRVAFTVE
jgi:uncharacterized cupredoxin-like copper-binding protein